MYSIAAKVLSNKIVQSAIILVLALLAAISIFAGIKNAIIYSQDFQWDAAKAISLQLDPYEMSLDEGASMNEDLASFYELFTDKGLKQKMEANQFPTLLALLLPYTFLEPLTARYAWIVSNILFTIAIIFLLRKTFLKELPTFEYVVLILLMLAGTPYRNQIGVGQHTLFAFCFYLLAVWLSQLSNPNRFFATICLAISYFKYTLTAPLALYFLYKKRFGEFIASVLLHIAGTAAMSLWLHKSMLYLILAPLKVSSALSAEGGLDLGALFNGSFIYLLVGAIVMLVLLLITFKLPAGNDVLFYAVLILWSLILMYHRTYDYFVVSSIGAATLGIIKGENNEQFAKIMRVYYYLLLLLIYFGLRIFNENLISRITIGTIYYIFTLLMTYFVVSRVLNETKGSLFTKQGIRENGSK